MDEHEQPCLTDKELRKLSRFTLKGSPIWLAAEALIRRDYEELNQPEIYLSVLNSSVGPRFKQRMIAAEALKFARLTAEQSERLGTILRAIVSRTHLHPIADFIVRTLNIAWKYVVVYAFIFACLFVSMWITREQYFNLAVFLLVMMSLLGIVCIFVVPIHSISAVAA
jgi:hypothetical protein